MNAVMRKAWGRMGFAIFLPSTFLCQTMNAFSFSQPGLCPFPSPPIPSPISHLPICCHNRPGLAGLNGVFRTRLTSCLSHFGDISRHRLSRRQWMRGTDQPADSRELLDWGVLAFQHGWLDPEACPDTHSRASPSPLNPDFSALFCFSPLPRRVTNRRDVTKGG
jgi:hypothetical protein